MSDKFREAIQAVVDDIIVFCEVVRDGVRRIAPLIVDMVHDSEAARLEMNEADAQAAFAIGSLAVELYDLHVPMPIIRQIVKAKLRAVDWATPTVPLIKSVITQGLLARAQDHHADTDAKQDQDGA